MNLNAIMFEIECLNAKQLLSYSVNLDSQHLSKYLQIVQVVNIKSYFDIKFIKLRLFFFKLIIYLFEISAMLKLITKITV